MPMKKTNKLLNSLDLFVDSYFNARRGMERTVVDYNVIQYLNTVMSQKPIEERERMYQTYEARKRVKSQRKKLYHRKNESIA